jgi:hypothetical protein
VQRRVPVCDASGACLCLYPGGSVAAAWQHQQLYWVGIKRGGGQARTHHAACLSSFTAWLLAHWRSSCRCARCSPQPALHASHQPSALNGTHNTLHACLLPRRLTAGSRVINSELLTVSSIVAALARLPLLPRPEPPPRRMHWTRPDQQRTKPTQHQALDTAVTLP